MLQLAAAGDIEDFGVSPYKIDGDPVTALIAQINRFAGKSVSLGSACATGSKVLLQAPFRLEPVLVPKAADTAWLIASMRYSCSPLQSTDRLRWTDQGATNTWTWALNNLTELTTVIAAYGDSLGLPAASVGITTRDPKLVPKFPYGTAALIAGLALGAGALYLRRAR